MNKLKQYWAPILLSVSLTSLLLMATDQPDPRVLAPKRDNQAIDTPFFSAALAMGCFKERTSGLAFREGPDTLLVANTERDEIWEYHLGGAFPYHPNVLKLGMYNDAVAPTASLGPAALLPSANGLIVSEAAGHRLSVIRKGTNRVEPLATSFGWHRLNGPNSAVFGPRCGVYFTDPPESPLHNLSGPDFGGIYRLGRGGDLNLVSSELARPVAIAYSNANHSLYVANGDPRQSLILAIPVDHEGNTSPSSIFADLTELNGRWAGQLGPLLTDKNGNVYAAGPGGIHAFDRSGRLLSVLSVENPISATTWGKWQTRQELYFTSNNVLYRTYTPDEGDRESCCPAP